MPRVNRRRGSSLHDEDSQDWNRVRQGWRRVEHRADGDWNVQPVSAERAVKEYLCPGCSQSIAPATAHLVTWRLDGILGDHSDLAARRHWHDYCWKIAR